jgi:hemerythrin
MNNNLYIVWNEDNKLGIPIIDEQHRCLISTINSLHFFIHNRIEDITSKAILIMLQQYTNIHFKTEELLLEKAGYTDLQKHIDLHIILAEQTKKIYQKNSIVEDPESILIFLKNWWVNHINNEDRKYVACLK